ncbi:MAG: hypothetical protein DRR16_30445 [Candidatus Parabeggiatoa sp. nov. 3]|nr:MAG: hypothetical protein DRQ99_26075 [Gammaproteobacteria bacterium]RKZ76399.1 MAG: hypothetical protein DRR16_30445 [Gammaproteobacteria bacterium]
MKLVLERSRLWRNDLNLLYKSVKKTFKPVMVLLLKCNGRKPKRLLFVIITYIVLTKRIKKCLCGENFINSNENSKIQ